ncbi:MAG: hypothetical protein LIP01_05355 [Tannerellaceae bacterium]|nr:hypothetical protein [Tannerellaceae bacterium]
MPVQPGRSGRFFTGNGNGYPEGVVYAASLPGGAEFSEFDKEVDAGEGVNVGFDCFVGATKHIVVYFRDPAVGCTFLECL